LRSAFGGANANGRLIPGQGKVRRRKKGLKAHENCDQKNNLRSIKRKKKEIMSLGGDRG